MSASSRPADATDAGRSCPYCRFPLKAGADATECGDCHAVHHADCWAEGGGCAVVGCTGRAESPTVVAPVATDAGAIDGFAASTAAGAPPAVPPAPPPPALATGTGPPWLALAVVLLAVVLAGAAAAFLLTGGEDPAPVAAAGPAATAEAGATPAATPDPRGPASGATGTAAAPASAGATGTATTDATAPTAEAPAAEPDTGALPDVPRARMQADVTTALRDFHEALVDRRWRVAWGLLSDRRRDYEQAEHGYDGWRTNQTTVADALGNPRTIRARIVSIDREDGSVQVDVDGPSYAGPCGFSGKTWAKYEDGGWRYDPGYAIAGRRAEWEPRQTELLLVCP